CGHLAQPLTFLWELDRRLLEGKTVLPFVTWRWSAAGAGLWPAGPSAILLQMLGEYALLHGLVAVGATWRAVRRLRRDLAAAASPIPAAPRPRPEADGE